MLAILVPKRLILLDCADVFALLLEYGLIGGSARLLNRGGVPQDAFEGLVGRLRQGVSPFGVREPLDFRQIGATWFSP